MASSSPVAIGRGLMSRPNILMLDEPSLGLSPLLCKELFQNLSHIRDIIYNQELPK